jgi:hypothetical protein
VGRTYGKNVLADAASPANALPVPLANPKDDSG